jgi:hypothetical protein
MADEWWANQTGLRQTRRTEVAVGQKGPDTQVDQWSIPSVTRTRPPDDAVRRRAGAGERHSPALGALSAGLPEPVFLRLIFRERTLDGKGRPCCASVVFLLHGIAETAPQPIT